MLLSWKPICKGDKLKYGFSSLTKQSGSLMEKLIFCGCYSVDYIYCSFRKFTILKYKLLYLPLIIMQINMTDHFIKLRQGVSQSHIFFMGWPTHLKVTKLIDIRIKYLYSNFRSYILNHYFLHTWFPPPSLMERSSITSAGCAHSKHYLFSNLSNVGNIDLNIL